MNPLQLLQEQMPENTDCLLVTSDVNRRYFTGFKSSAGVLAVFRDGAYLLVDSRYSEMAKKAVKICKVAESNTQYKYLNKLFVKRNVKTISIESTKITIAGLAAMNKAFPNVEIDTSSFLSDKISDIRMVKSPLEIEKMKTAQNIAERGFEYVLNYVKSGVTEKELAYLLNDYIYKHAENIAFETIVLSGENTSLPHGTPTDRVLQNNEFILFDFGAVYDGYRSDMTRTVCLGTPNESMKLVYETVMNAQNAAFLTVKAGVKCKAVDTAARKVISNAKFGKYFGHGLGHGVGLEVHEKPTANQREKSVLKAGNILTVEPGIYIPKQFGVRIEDMVLITENGYENLTHTDKTLKIL